MRAVADLIRQAFELGAFQAGPYVKVGDSIRSWLVGGTSEIVPQDGLKTPLWVPVVWNLVLDRVLSPELFGERVSRIHERATLLAQPDSHDKQFWQLAGMPGPAMLEEWAKRGWPIDIEVTEEEVAMVADAIDREADRIVAEAIAATDGAGATAAAPPTTPVVFISSTIEDLVEYRDRARDAALAANFFPRMKEYFAARGDKPLLAVCLEKVSGS
jgi:hypothetical protein